MAKVGPDAGKIKIICGLGNPGEEYIYTRHNAGFRAIDVLGERHQANYWKDELGSLTAHVTIGDYNVILAKPMSFMNRSGGPLSKLCREYDVGIDEILVIHDELDIPEGDVRIKVGGGHAGHNGLKSIIEKFGSKEFARVRIGIDRPPGRMPVPKYVLSEPKGESKNLLDIASEYAADACEDAITLGVIHARDIHNAPKTKN